MSKKSQLTQATKGLMDVLPDHLAAVPTSEFLEGRTLGRDMEGLVFRLIRGKTDISVKNIMPDSLWDDDEVKSYLKKKAYFDPSNEQSQAKLSRAAWASRQLVEMQYADPFIERLTDFPDIDDLRSASKAKILDALKWQDLYTKVSHVALDELGHCNMGTDSTSDLHNSIRDYVTQVIMHMHIPKKSEARRFVNLPDCDNAIANENDRLGIETRKMAS